MFKKQNQIESIVLLRGIAALGVCFVHFYLANGAQYSQFMTRLFFSGQLGVSMFFVISGFVLPYSLSQKNYTIKAFPNFLLKRSIRIDPPYWATIGLLFLLGGVSWHFDISRLVLHIFYLIPLFKDYQWYNNIFWTLCIEFQYYILLGLFFPLLMRLKPLVSILIFVLISLICLLLKVNIRELIFTYLYDFAAGYIVFQYFIKKISLKTAVICLMAFCTVVAFKVSILTGFIPAATGLTILLLDKKVPALFLFLGNISYSLYLTHTIAMPLYLRFIKTYVSNQAFLCVTAILISIIFAYVFYVLIEKPALKFSKKVKLN
ncbi:Peptidoglycan/LPS O-acetylase OafA/YrhL, contains acyltransferase and SGNH-hydrolase domains [Mucilaginibacter lappiensis]|uniref:Peptidoglycan/LPS O-acetylase OafA/YrhL n=1 Tax=Mucilaginibacter lappiensis TaxID=354630 RepID=A0ABR6PRC2_9SPHI|nr:acyltransferase [Mucilaginibacter lappiensis]MBB6112322.1 peptidoglycan/LPS O-acetylase OafA/YrhL [Mucilaginibacter lappiensis]SIR97127.1 Peptidoglycan/LPS O-acetylase OafA/YrhL, contains acyltransferase and SGNH-hydrolase domains [Mucilaginibacter lappiensis]